jgi:streptogramin lyase
MIRNLKKRVFHILFLVLIQLGLKAQTTSSLYTFNLNQGEKTSGLVRSSTGDFYFIKNGLTIEKLSANGTVSTFATVSGTPSSLAIDSNDNLYFIRLSSMTIRKVSPQGIITTHASLSSIFNASRFSSLRCDSSGNLYFLVDNSYIYRCSSTTFNTSMIYSGSYIGELAIDNQRNIYFSVIRKELCFLLLH